MLYTSIKETKIVQIILQYNSKQHFFFNNWTCKNLSYAGHQSAADLTQPEILLLKNRQVGHFFPIPLWAACPAAVST